MVKNIKNIIKNIFVSILVLTLMSNIISAGGKDITKDYPYQELSKVEIQGIYELVEEEKLARDVYLTFYDLYSANIFKNIAGAESEHITAMINLINKYDLQNPILNDERGVFVNKKFQDLYLDLTTKGSVSLLEALKVGATIEDLDIYDLDEFILKSDNDDIKATYQNLKKSSRNHMRSFMKNIEKEGGDYQVQFISASLQNEILSSEQEKGILLGPNGEIVGTCDEEGKEKNKGNGKGGQGNINSNFENSNQNEIGFFKSLWNSFLSFFN